VRRFKDAHFRVEIVEFHLLKNKTEFDESKRFVE